MKAIEIGKHLESAMFVAKLLNYAIIYDDSTYNTSIVFNDNRGYIRIDYMRDTGGYFIVSEFEGIKDTAYCFAIDKLEKRIINLL